MINLEKSHPFVGSARPQAMGSRLAGHVPLHERVSATLLLRPRPGSPALPDLEYWQKTPPGQRKYPSPEEYTRVWGASQEDLDAVAHFASSHGLTVEESHAGRLRVVVAGTVEQMNAAFSIQLNHYRAPVRNSGGKVDRKDHREVHQHTEKTQIHRGYEGPLHLPAALMGIVTAVIGLDNRKLGGPAGTGDPASAFSLLPTALGQLYNFPTGSAKNQTIGLFADANGGACFLPADITEFIKNLPAGFNAQPNVTAIGLTVDGTTYTNDTSLITGGVANGSAYEITQDISTSSAIAQGANINVYLTEDSESGWEAFLNRAIVPDAGDNAPTVLSASWVLELSDDSGTIGDPGTMGTLAYVLTGLLQKAAHFGITVFIALGDWGSDNQLTDGHCHLGYPNCDPWVTSCGGTIVGSVSGTTPATFTEVVWSDAFSGSPFGSSTSDFGATGGGVSDNFAIPPYQTAANLTPTSKNDGKVRRGAPDVAGMVGLYGFFLGGSGYGFTGTSCVAPLYAGLTAMLNAALGQSIGFLNPTLYANAAKIFSDVTSGNNDSGDPAVPPAGAAPFFVASAGWDPCTGWGSINGTNLLTALIGTVYTQSVEFWVNKGTFGLDEVIDTSSWPTSFWVVLEGFAPYQLGSTLPVPALSGDFFNYDGVISITPNASGPVFQDQSLTYTPQRVMFPYDISFQGSAATITAAFPAAGSDPEELLLTAKVTVGGTPYEATTVFELVPGADPYFTNINPSSDNVFWLSQDLRVFTVTPGINATPVTGNGTAVKFSTADPTALDTSAAYSYIQGLIGYLNSNYETLAGTDPLNALLPLQAGFLTGDGSVTPTSPNPGDAAKPYINYNFAIARVRLRGAASSSAQNVKVFFRLFLTQTNDTDFQPTTTYLSTMNGNLPESPLVGANDETIPFFATGNISGETDYGANGANNQNVTIAMGSDSVWAYYGCFLNVYDPDNLIGSNPVQTYLAGTHHCLVAQIAYDGAPIANSNGTTVSPENSDKLAQRNLQITASDNPGAPATHRIPQTFDLRPSTSIGDKTGGLLEAPDELMITWGKTPVESTASIYWPQVEASEVLELAGKLYLTHQLYSTDSHTIAFPVIRGITYVPIPRGSGQNFAGLFTVDLPSTVRKGQEFNVIVRRISTRRPVFQRDIDSAPDLAGSAAPRDGERSWRYVVGTFQVRIPVDTKKMLLHPEENTLAILKWRLEKMAPTNRWHAVMKRYIAYIAARVDGLGGHASLVPPSLSGYPAHHSKPIAIHPSPGGEFREVTGKVTGIMFDRFGDFEGFLLLTESGHERSFHSIEARTEHLVRYAWVDRIVISVLFREHEPHVPVSIILRRPPHPPREW